MENTFFEYTVTWYDEFNEEKPWCEVITKGLCVASSFAEAMTKIENGFDNIERVALAGINDIEFLDYEDLLFWLNPDANKESVLGPQLIAALQEAIDVTKEEE